MTKESENAPVVAATTAEAKELPGKGTPMCDCTAPAVDGKRRRLAIHVIVRKESDHRIALCGHRIANKHTVQVPSFKTTGDAVYDYYPCLDCESMIALEKEATAFIIGSLKNLIKEAAS